MLHLVQTVHLSWANISTISKQNETIIHFTYEYHWVRPKWLLTLWYGLCKPRPFLAPTLTMSPIGSKRNSTWQMSPRSSIGCTQNNFWAYGTFGTNRAPILHWHYCLQTDQNEIPHDPSHLVVISGASKMISKPVICSAQSVHLSWVKISTISQQNETSIHLSLVT
jgi:hypothetical protein